MDSGLQPELVIHFSEFTNLQRVERGEAWQKRATRGKALWCQVAPDVRCCIRVGDVNTNVHISGDNAVGDSGVNKVVMKPNGDNTPHDGQVHINPQGWNASTT